MRKKVYLLVVIGVLIGTCCWGASVDVSDDAEIIDVPLDTYYKVLGYNDADGKRALQSMQYNAGLIYLGHGSTNTGKKQLFVYFDPESGESDYDRYPDGSPVWVYEEGTETLLSYKNVIYFPSGDANNMSHDPLGGIKLMRKYAGRDWETHKDWGLWQIKQIKTGQQHIRCMMARNGHIFYPSLLPLGETGCPNTWVSKDDGETWQRHRQDDLYTTGEPSNYTKFFALDGTVYASCGNYRDGGDCDQPFILRYVGDDPDSDTNWVPAVQDPEDMGPDFSSVSQYFQLSPKYFAEFKGRLFVGIGYTGGEVITFSDVAPGCAEKVDIDIDDAWLGKVLARQHACYMSVRYEDENEKDVTAIYKSTDGVEFTPLFHFHVPEASAAGFHFEEVNGDFYFGQSGIKLVKIPNESYTDNMAPELDAGPDQTINWPENEIDLSGSVTDDGKPNGHLSHDWRFVGGPGSVTFGDSTKLNTTATFSRDGIYMLELTAEDGDFNCRDMIRIFVKPANSLTADAGSDQAVTDDDGDGSATVTLDGSGSSDPDGTIESYSWTEGGTEIATGETPQVTLAVGTHDITLTVTDNDGATDSDSVTITVEGQNTAPSVSITNPADGDTFTAPADLGVTADASDSDGSIEGVSLSINGTHIHTEGLEPYQWGTAHPDRTDEELMDLSAGDYTLTAEATDNDGASSTDSITITVEESNNAPNASDDSPTTDEDTEVTVDVLANDDDPDGDTLSVTDVTTPSNGAATINDDDTVTYTPDPDYNGSDSFDYTVSDGNGGTDTATVTITVNDVNDGPVADAGADQTVADTDNDGSETVSLDGSASSDPDGTIASYSWIEDATEIATGATPEVTLDVGTHDITLTVTDDDGATDSDTVTITISDPNDAPTAQDDEISTDEDTATGNIHGTLLDNDSDPEGDGLDINAVDDGAATGTVSFDDGSDSLSYDPNGQFDSLGTAESATDTFTYTIGDGNGGTDSATVTVTITGVNDPPTIGGLIDTPDPVTIGEPLTLKATEVSDPED
ncbi:MAG: tandem-95 repeat protein, partial [Planctomycetes bacterium]|nr:tandem-95 repeat protein [Planctomycetota bacterium]